MSECPGLEPGRTAIRWRLRRIRRTIVGAMPDMQQEFEHLAQADRHLLEGERRIADQIILIEELTAKGHDTTGAEELLRNFEQTRETWRVHRELILDTLGRG
jgi:hypothetical protein